MPITRKLVAPDDNDDNQWLKVDSNKRYITNDMDDWQFLFGPGSALTTSTQILKIAAEFDKDDFDGMRIAAYLYNPASGTVSSVATCTFNVFKVTTPTWTEQLIASFAGALTYNSYFFKDVTSVQLPGVDLFGGDTIMIEAVVTRLSETYRDRIYVNHLGIYDNAFRLRQDVDFLDISKLDE